jgi:hypothetical protein
MQKVDSPSNHTFWLGCHAEPEAKHLAKPWPDQPGHRFFVEPVLSHAEGLRMTRQGDSK